MWNEVADQFLKIVPAQTADTYRRFYTLQLRMAKIFSEDLQMLELQQRNLSDYPDRKLLKLNIDAGGVQSRRVIDRWLQKEQEVTA